MVLLGVLVAMIATYYVLTATGAYDPRPPDPCPGGTTVVRRDALGVKTGTYCIAGPAPQDAR